MHYNTGYHREAVPLVRRFVEMFRDAEAICVPSASCVAMMREHYEMMAEAEGDLAFIAEVRSLLPRVFEFSELLVNRLGVEDVGASFPHSVTYHPSCHSLRMLHVGDAPVKLLHSVRGLVPFHSFSTMPHRVAKMMMLAMCSVQLAKSYLPIFVCPME